MSSSFGPEIMKGPGVYLVDLYNHRGQWVAGYAAIANGGAVVEVTTPDGSQSLTIRTPETGSYTNLPLSVCH